MICLRKTSIIVKLYNIIYLIMKVIKAGITGCKSIKERSIHFWGIFVILDYFYKN
jgi:hypothetical protein